MRIGYMIFSIPLSSEGQEIILNVTYMIITCRHLSPSIRRDDFQVLEHLQPDTRAPLKTFTERQTYLPFTGTMRFRAAIENVPTFFRQLPLHHRGLVAN